MKSRLVLPIALVLLFLSANVLAADEWVEVRSKNFHLIGNAKEKDIIDVATKLEQFRQVFGYIFPKLKLTDSVETNVIVFKDVKSYEPFLPKRADGKADKWIAGYFLGGRETNYITLSADRSREDTFETIFHEYVHYLLSNNFKRSEIPIWLNEGLAEYYSTFAIEDDQRVLLGNLINNNLSFLSSNELIPLRRFFNLTNYEVHQTGGHSRSVFYAQAWALIHYFAVKNETDKFAKFIELSRTSSDSEKAFKESFGLGYSEMELVLREYVQKKKFIRLVVSFKEKITFDNEIQSSPLTSAGAYGFLGDLSYRQREFGNAETYLAKALFAEPDQIRANTTMGLVMMSTRRFDEAKRYLEKAVSDTNPNYYALYSYAYALSRENKASDGFITFYEKTHADKMRSLLTKSIELNPEFTENYNLYAFINLVRNEDLDQSVVLLQKALRLHPGNERSTMSLAQVYLRQNKFEEAASIAEGVLNSALDEDLRSAASKVLSMIRGQQENEVEKKRVSDLADSGGDLDGKGPLKRRLLTDEEVDQINAEHRMSKLNSEITKARVGESQSVGYFENVTCSGSNISYRIKTVDGKLITLSSNGFQGLELLSIIKMPENEVFGCSFKSSVTRAVVNFDSGGVLTAVTFVQPIFRLKSAEEIKNDKRIVFVRNPATGVIRPFEADPGDLIDRNSEDQDQD